MEVGNGVLCRQHGMCMYTPQCVCVCVCYINKVLIDWLIDFNCSDFFCWSSVIIIICFFVLSCLCLSCCCHDFLQDCKGLPDIPRPAADVASEHGWKTLREEQPRRGCSVPGAQCCSGRRVPEHVGRPQVSARRLCHLPGKKTTGQLMCAHLLYMSALAIALFFLFLFIHTEYFLQRAGGVCSLWWCGVTRRGGHLLREILHWDWPRGTAWAGCCLFLHGESRRRIDGWVHKWILTTMPSTSLAFYLLLIFN